MTDAEIIKALECHAKENLDTCALCPLLNVEGCGCKSAEYALVLINRQKAEIERLQKENNQFADIGKMYSEIKADTIKKYKHTIRTLFRLKFLRKKPYDEIFDEAEAMMLRRIAGEVKDMAGDTE